MAEGFIRRQLADRGVEGVEVESAGVSGWDESPATEEAVEALRELDIDISEHLARRLTSRLVEAADLVVAMADEHREAVSRVVPSAAPRTFTLKELVRLLESDGEPGEGSPPDQRIRAGVERAEARRARGDQAPGDEDVGDPLGLGLEAYRATAWELEELSARLVAGLLGRGGQSGESAAREGGAA
jgi:protein-tyrosine phosphatase